MAVGDLNGDGQPDLAVANQGDGTVSVLLDITTPGSSVASFTAQQVFAVGGSPVAVVLGDVNGDGKRDILVANSVSNTVSVLVNTTAPGSSIPSFASQQTVATGSTPVSLALGDFNGDGQPDLVVANSGSNTLSVLLNANAPWSRHPASVPSRHLPPATTHWSGHWST